MQIAVLHIFIIFAIVKKTAAGSVYPRAGRVAVSCRRKESDMYFTNQ